MASAAKKTATLGLPPGTLVYVGPKRQRKTKITVIDYDANHVEEKEIQKIEDCFVYKEKKSITWINIDGIEQVEVIQKINDHFGIHPLVAEDIVNTDQRPKVENYGDYIFIAVKMLSLNAKDEKVIAEHISLIVGSNYVISFQESIGDIFNIIRERIRQGKGRVRRFGADYLAYCLLDTIVDHYFLVLENLGEMIEGLEQEILKVMEDDTPRLIHLLKRDVIFLRKQVWPLREVISSLQRTEATLITKDTTIFLGDVYDHTIQVMDTIESYRDILSGMHDVYLSSLSHHMNEVMKFLTIFTSVFIPLNFVVGIYGMNFKNMPELEWEWGYFSILGLMAIMGTSMLIYFKRKRWI